MVLAYRCWLVHLDTTYQNSLSMMNAPFWGCFSKSQVVQSTHSLPDGSAGKRHGSGANWRWGVGFRAISALISSIESWLNQSSLTNRVESRKYTHFAIYVYVILKKDCLKRGVKFLHPWRLGIFFSGPRDVVEFQTCMSIYGRWYLIHPWKLTTGSPTNHPTEIRKIIWTKPPWLGVSNIFKC